MVELLNFEKKYGKRLILKSDEICFEKGRISFLMAPNGAGKTTLLKCITALERYDGEIRISGEKNTDHLRECLVIWDDCPFFNDLSGLKNLLILSEDKMNKSRIKQLALKSFNEELLNRRVKTYSYGQRKKLALILAEILNPSLLIMDEISNGLDLDSMFDLQDRLRELSAADRTIILTGHQLGFYEKIYDDLYLIKDCKLVKADPSKEKSLEEVYCEEIHHDRA